MENKYVVSARKYRPSLFREVVGQETVTQTLKNAILTDHLAQAYLFCGPRGIGKTTVARILAKTINCENITPEGEPCNECESCKAFMENRSYNIHELDAASNNSIEDMRNLIDQVRIPPQMARYSVYIIDEVHMLSQSAFNAFLKTLEEPPPYAIFILATTEKHKILPTILSRCQVFDFNRIGVEAIVRHLEYVAGQEGVDAEPEALSVIAQKADGALRDALSVFDQLVSFSGKKLTYSSVIKSLNVLDYDYYFKLTEAFLAGDARTALLIFDEILTKGFDAQHFLTGLSSHFRDLLVAHDKATLSLLEVGAAVREKYLTQAVQAPADFLFRALDVCYQADISIRTSKNPRLHVELVLLKISSLKKNDEPVGKELKRTENIPEPEKKEAGTSTSKGPETTADKNVKETDASVVIEKKEEKEPVSAEEKKNPEVASQVAETPAQPTAPEEEKREKETEQVKEEPPVSGTPRYSEEETETISISNILNGKISGPVSDAVKEPEGETQGEPVREKPFDVEALRQKWSSYADSLAHDKPRLAAALRHHHPDKTDDHTIRITVENKNLKEAFEIDLKPDLMKYLRKELENDRISLRIDVDDKPADSKKPYTAEEKYEYMKRKNPEIEQMRKLFDLDFE
jgi:DNA polymerase-3 subunit gamma/tau